MLDKLSKSIIQFMVSQSTEYPVLCSLSGKWDSYNDISIKELSAAVKCDEEIIAAAISFLVENNLAEYRILSSKVKPVITGFRLKHQGIHYKEIRWLKKKEQWKERAIGFFSGVLVTVIGGLIAKLFAG